jgi:hypothetical protein
MQKSDYTKYKQLRGDQLRSLYYYPLSFIQLVSSIIPGRLTALGVKDYFIKIFEWVKNSPDSILQEKLNELLPILDNEVQALSKALPPKRPWPDISADYEVLCRDKSYSWSTGLSFGWLDQRFDCNALRIPSDLPYHASIGVGHHAGYIAIMEELLLHDAFFMLLTTKTSMSNLSIVAESVKNERSTDFYPKISILNQNVCTYARLTVTSFYAFIECFVNSIGEDFIARNPGLSPEKQELLRGIKKGRYLSIESKIEKFPSIIRSDGKIVHILSDPAQIEEPFSSFVRQLKEIRDSSVHHSKQKANIWLGPPDWIQLADKVCTTCIDVAKLFWSACYPDRPQPLYLYSLDKNKLTELAITRQQMDANQ